jgi:hypothetical protein
VRILWVEDNRLEIRKLEKRIREEYDQLTIVTNVGEAETMARAIEFSWVILDSNFPSKPDQAPYHAGISFYRDLRSGTFGAWGSSVRVWFFSNWAEYVVDQVKTISPLPQRVLAKMPNNDAAWDEYLKLL